MADLKWNEVNANFNDVNSGVGHAISAYSNVGNIFGNLRKSILDEEQRAKDNAFKQKQMDENIRQFDLRLGFDAVRHKDDMSNKQLDREQRGQFHKDDMDYKYADLKQKAAQHAESMRLGWANNKTNQELANARLKLAQRADERAQAEADEKEWFKNSRKMYNQLTQRPPSDASPAALTEWQKRQKTLIEDLDKTINDPNASDMDRHRAVQLKAAVQEEQQSPAMDSDTRLQRQNVFMGSIGDQKSAEAAATGVKDATARGISTTKEYKQNVRTAYNKADSQVNELKLTDTQQNELNSTVDYINSRLPAGISIDPNAIINVVKRIHGVDNIKNTFKPNASFSIADKNIADALSANLANALISEYPVSDEVLRKAIGDINTLWFQNEQQKQATNENNANRAMNAGYESLTY